VGRQAQRLRQLIDSGEHFIAAEAYSALTGRIVERIGFKAAYLGGHACSAFHYAMPDIGIFSQVEQIEQAARIVAAIDIPLIVDADTLGETVADAFHYTRRYERAGIAGIHVEDEANPKHSSYVQRLIPIPAMQARIEACVKARHDPPFVIIARCDELFPVDRTGGGGGSVEEAIRRGCAYAEAGADALVYPVAPPEALLQVKKAIPVPLIVSGRVMPQAACTLYGGYGWMGAARLHIERSRELFKTGKVDANLQIEDKAALIEEDVFGDVIADWAKKTGRPTR